MVTLSSEVEHAINMRKEIEATRSDAEAIRKWEL